MVSLCTAAIEGDPDAPVCEFCAVAEVEFAATLSKTSEYSLLRLSVVFLFTFVSAMTGMLMEEGSLAFPDAVERLLVEVCFVVIFLNSLNTNPPELLESFSFEAAPVSLVTSFPLPSDVFLQLGSGENTSSLSSG